MKRRRQLVSMLVAGSAPWEPPAFANVLQVLAGSFVFRLGGVLVGTQAFRCYSNMLGVRFQADVDIAGDSSISVAVAREASLDLLDRLRAVEPRFAAVPELDPRDPSTSFKVRGRDLRIDFLTTTRRGTRRKPVPLPHLNVAALPVDGLDYLIETPVQAAVVGGSGILVNVPLPARYALHKMWVAKSRPVAEQAKARKDLAQARQLLDVLRADRPGDLDAAAAAMRNRPAMWKKVEKELRPDSPVSLPDRRHPRPA